MHPIAWLLAPSSAPSVACPRMPGPVGRPVAADPRGPESAYAASAIAGSRRGSAIRPAETDRWTHRRPCLRSFVPIVVTRSRTGDHL